jgi:hypothetical protein
MPPDEKNTIVSALENLLENPVFLEKLAQASIKKIKRPPSVSKLSNFSYYREQFGREQKVALDIMIESKKDIEWKYSEYPELKPASLYQRVYQGLRFVLECLDQEGHYFKYRQMMVLHKTGTSVRLSWIRDLLEGKTFAPSTVTDREKTYEWKDKVEEFIEDRKQKILHLKNLSLTPEQIQDLQLSFEANEGIMAVISEKEIKIVKDKSMCDSIEEEV